MTPGQQAEEVEHLEQMCSRFQEDIAQQHTRHHKLFNVLDKLRYVRNPDTLERILDVIESDRP